MSREDFLKEIHLKKDKNNKIDLLTLYPIIDKACEEMQEIIDSKVQEIKKQKIWGMKRRDDAHKFNKELLSFKNRACENCKYDNFENSRCDLKKHVPSFYLDGFFCNRWETK